MRGLLQNAWDWLPSSTKRYLRGVDWYEKLSRYAHPDRKQNFDDEVRFHEELFRTAGISPRLIFDVGANCGEKTAVYVALGASVVSVEPTPELVTHLRERYRGKDQVTVAACAASSSAGKTTLWRVDKFCGAMNTINQKNREILLSGVNSRTPDHMSASFGESVEVEMKTLDMFISEFGRPDYVKIDAEGHDKDIIDGLSCAIPLVSFELALPEFVDESMMAVDHFWQLSPGARFQAREADSFILPDWVSAEEIKTVIRGDNPYLEVFVSMRLE
jgi:FkbM family methyltransferase